MTSMRDYGLGAEKRKRTTELEACRAENERLRAEIQALRAQQEAQAQYAMIHEEDEH